MNKEEFISKAKETHTISYDYSLLQEKIKCEDKVDIICQQHGIFHPRASRFLKGSNCPLCSKKALKTTELFIEEYKEKFGIYDLSKFEYKDSHTKGIAICNKHGEFTISPTNLLGGSGCPECKKDKLKHIFSSTKEEFISKASKIHQNRYEYIGEYTNNSTPILTKCNVCGNTFYQIPHNHLQGKGCPFCNQSHLEKELKTILDNNNINYNFQQKFEWLGKQTLDFYFPELNIAIECQGVQHFAQTKYGDIETNISNDEKKYNLCKDNNVQLYYLLNHNVNDLPSFYSKDNIISSLNEIYSFFKINPIFTDICNFLDENKQEYHIINNTYIQFNNIVIYPILNNHIFNYENECNDISISNEKQGIKTYWIKQYEWEDENKQNILKSFILTDCGIIKRKVYARNCFIKEISNDDVKDFLIKNSMYGFRRSSVILGLFEKESEELLMVYTFGHAFYGKGKYDIEVLRVATKTYTQVIGGASKLWSHFLNNYKTIKIGNKNIEWKNCVYYVDFDHNNGKSLHYLGFDFDYYTKGGFHNYNKYTNKINNRKPTKHSQIIKLIHEDILIKIPTSGTKVYVFKK